MSDTVSQIPNTRRMSENKQKKLTKASLERNHANLPSAVLTLALRFQESMVISTIRANILVFIIPIEKNQ